ncbi:hypothetical protein BH24ACT15_BH24ACT15_09270 [soil metagenome]
MLAPLLLDFNDQPVVCVGAGPVARKKVIPLVRAGAVVTVIAPVLDDELEPVQTVHRRRYRTGDLEANPPVRLVIAGTGVPTVDQQVAADAAALGIWCLRTDGAGDVHVPAVVRQGGLTVALATGAPALSRRLRQRLEAVIEPRWGRASSTLSALRADPEVRAALGQVAPEERQARWHHAVDTAVDSDRPEEFLRGILTGKIVDP